MAGNFVEYFHEGLLSALKNKLADIFPKKEQAICGEVRSLYPSIVEANKNFVKDDLTKTHVGMLSMVLAAYRALDKYIPDQKKRLAVVEYAFLEPAKSFVPQMEEALQKSPDPFQLIINSSKEKENNFYGDSFIFERERDDGQAYFLNVKKCFYCDFLAANHAFELGPVFCNWDDVFGDILNRGQYNVVFERPETIARGGTLCRFRFKRAK